MASLNPASIDAFMQTIPWHPKPLRRDLRAAEYPVAYLPPIIRDAVEEVQAYVQAPMALVAACALAVVSAAVQARFDVRRDAVLTGPSSLYFMTIAETGERKSAIDKLFMAPLVEWQSAQARKYRQQMAEYDSAFEAWEERGKDLIILNHQAGTELDPRKLHEASKPKEPRKAKMLRGEDTTEALLRAMQDYPVAAIISAEAGLIFGGHSMSGEKAMGTLAAWNQMWDSATIEQDRIERGLIHIENPRATLGLMIQSAVLKNFMLKNGDLATGMGFFARCLFSQPDTTQGTRYYVEPPAHMPALRAFTARITELLDVPAEFDAFDRLAPTVVELDPDSRKTWVAFHDEVEEQLGGDDHYSDIKGVAAKAAENAARLACCYHAFNTATEFPPPIPRTTMSDACAVMRWYLEEAVRFGEVAVMTEDARNAELLEIWLVRQVREKKGNNLTVAIARKMGPNPLRNSKKLEDVLELLEDLGRIRVTKPTGTKKRYIEVAPQVIKEWS